MDRKQAFEAGIFKYDTGKPCKRGHWAMRYTTSGACVECIKGYADKYSTAGIHTARIGLVEMKCMVHRDDLALIQIYIDALAMDRRAKRDLELAAAVQGAFAKDADKNPPKPRPLMHEEQMLIAGWPADRVVGPTD